MRSGIVPCVRLLWIGITFALVAACSQPAPAPLIFNTAPWQDGEQHTLAITNAEGQPAGTLTFTITSGTDASGEGLWSIEREADTLGDREKVTVKVSPQGFRPQASYLERSNAGTTESVDAQYEGSQVDLTLNTKSNVMSVQRVQIPSDARETVTLPMIVRALPLSKNYSTQLNSFLPIAGLIDRVTVRVSSEEDVTVPAGTYKTWVVELDTGDAQSKLWIAQAAPYPLVKYLEGRNKATFELTAFRPQG